MRTLAFVTMVAAVVIAAPLGIVAIRANPLASEKTAEPGAKGPLPDSERSGVVLNVGDWPSEILTRDPDSGQPWTYVSPEETSILFLRDECIGSPLNQGRAEATIKKYLAAHEAELRNPIRQGSPPVFLNCFEETPGSVKLVVALAPLPVRLDIPAPCAKLLESDIALGAEALELPEGCQPPVVPGSDPQIIRVPADVSEVTQP